MTKDKEIPAFVSIFTSNEYGMKYKSITRHTCATMCYDVPQKTSLLR